MIDYNTIKQVKEFESRIKALGFQMVPYKWASKVNYITLIPAEDHYPMFARDAAIASGTLEDLSFFLNGLEWMKQYHYMLKVADDTKVSKKEQMIRNRQLMDKLGESNGK